MKTNNDLNDQWLADLFEKMPLEDVSDGFTENLMRQIENDLQKAKRKARWITMGQAAAGVGGILLTPAVLWFTGFSLPPLHLRFDPIVLSTGISILLLLIADMLLRKYNFSQKHKTN
ncbi:MAG: hypothetical protein FWF52_01495 [Candidatus Azobacteroides sp.]|nr:hypothetical protein [Candidatus Azobacteroides sp.]